MMKTNKFFMALLIALMSALFLAGCSDKQAETEPVEYNFEAQIEKVYFVDPLEYTSFVEALPTAPDFKEDGKTALDAYRNAASIENLTAGKWYLTNGENHLLVDEAGAVRVVNPSESTSKLVDVKLFKSENNKLVLVGFKAIDNCRVPVMVTLMDDGAILNENVYDGYSSVDTLGLEDGYDIVMKGQYMTLVSRGTSLKFYRFGEEVSGEYQMPEKTDGAYSSVFLGKDGTLYLTLISTNKDNPWLQVAKVDEGVNGLTGKIFTVKEGYAFPIYTKKIDGTDVEYTALMDMNTYNAYVYMMYPTASDLTIQPNVNFEIIKPNEYVPETEESETETTSETEGA
ncbi:MAG: hypothetical protein Q4D02_03950 [Clostridia bacterium]|nr:hypothetical protein [Clostridia bacterium]